MVVGGSGRVCYLEATITNNGIGALTSVSINSRGYDHRAVRHIHCPGDAAEIGYDDLGYLYIRDGDTSLMGHRTDASDDDLILTQRAINTITVTTNSNATVVFMARGSSL